MNKATIVIRTICISALLSLVATTAVAHGIEEFDRNSGVWKISPRKITRTNTPGWQNTVHDSEGAIHNTPSPTLYTYYWKLTRTYDLTNSDAPELDMKYEFLGGDYSAFKVQIGAENAMRNSDFTTILERNSATGIEEGFIPIHEYGGQVVKIRVLLKKNRGIVADSPGLIVHRAGVAFPAVSAEVDDDPDSLFIGAFNVQVFGKSKMRQDDVASSLVSILSRYDLVLFQEIRDSSETAIYSLMEMLNTASGGQYDIAISDRLGRTNSKEQYAYIYKTAKLSVVDSYHYDDGPEPAGDIFEREPYIVRFRANNHDVDFSVVGIHTAPDHAREELDALTAVHDDAVTVLGDEDVILMGDFNSSCNYVRASHFAGISLRTDPRFTWHILDSADTTTSATVCAYDRFVTTSGMTSRVADEGAQVFYFDQAYDLDMRAAKLISDHYPVEMRINLTDD